MVMTSGNSRLKSRAPRFFCNIPNSVTCSIRESGTIIAQVPAAATTGPIQVTVNGVVSNSVAFTVTPLIPSITALSEASGIVGDPITINGIGFGSSGTLAFNGVAASPSLWSDSAVVTQIPVGAQTGPVTVASGGQTSNGFTLTIIGAPTLGSVSPASGDVGTPLTISGTNFGTATYAPAVVFNGVAVKPTTWTSNTIGLTVPKGTTTGPLTIRVGYASSNSITFTVVPAGSQVFSISPANATLGIGQTLNLSLNDDLEHNITGATWSLSDNTLAQLSNSDPPVLTASSAGTVTVTATLNNLSATAQITISPAGVVMSAGTVLCSLPQITNEYTVLKIMQMMPTDGPTPDLVAVESDGQSSIWLRGLSAACEQQWHTRIGSVSGYGDPDAVLSVVPDNSGGLIVLLQNTHSSLARIDGSTGRPTWRYDSAGVFPSAGGGSLQGLTLPSSMAIDQNGYIVAVEDLQTSQRLVKIDGTIGAQVANWGWPSSTYNWIPGNCGPSGSYTLVGDAAQPFGSGPVTVGPDGSYNLEVIWSNTVGWYTYPSDSPGCVDEYVPKVTSTVNMRSMTVSPDGSASMIPLANNCPSDFPNQLLGNVIPDGNGGPLAATSCVDNSFSQKKTQVTDIGNSGTTATMPTSPNGTPSDMVLGDQGAYFTTDGIRVTAVNESSGDQIWSWQPTQGFVEIIAATAGGGVAVRNIQSPCPPAQDPSCTGPENVVRIDSTGNSNPDTWGTSSGSAGYGVLSKAGYYASGVWAGLKSSVYTEIVGVSTVTRGGGLLQLRWELRRTELLWEASLKLLPPRSNI